MKSLKRILAFLAATIALIWLSGIRCFAVGVAPVVAGEEIAEVLITLLLGAGHSQSELDNMSVTELQSLADKDLKDGRISSNIMVRENNQDMPLSEWLLLYGRPDTLIMQGLNTFIKNSIDNIIANVDGEVLFTPTPIVDMRGYGAVFVSSGTTYYCQKIILNPDANSYTIVGPYYMVSEHFGEVYRNGSFTNTMGSDQKYYGDVQYLDGTQAPTADEYEYVVGEADGTKVTLDMLNPDGSVTIDGVTYYPADYFDPDKLTDKGKDKLIYDITNVFNNTYVKSEDKPLVDEDDITVEVAEELENFTVPTGIITVFPFCLPFDFVRGIKTLLQKPKVPVFTAELDLTDFCGYDLGKHEIVISFEDWEPAAVVCRWFFILLFTYTLILITPRICKGAG